MSSYTRQQLEDWIKKIDVKADRVLDVGGSQNPITKRVNSWNVKEYKILDLAQPHECKVKPDIVWDLNLYGIPLLQYFGKFDIAFCLEVSEYWYDPLQALKNISWFLKGGGELYISFHFIYPHHNPPEQDYLRYTLEGAKKLLKEAGFEIEEIVGRTAGRADLMQAWWSAERMRPSQIFTNHNLVGCLIKARKL